MQIILLIDFSIILVHNSTYVLDCLLYIPIYRFDYYTRVGMIYICIYKQHIQFLKKLLDMKVLNDLYVWYYNVILN